MKYLLIIATILALIACARAQYISEGWKPGQPQQDVESPFGKASPPPVKQAPQPGVDAPTEADLAAEAQAKLDAANEGITEWAMRYIYVNFLGHNHTTVSAHRRTVSALAHPDLHPRIEVLSVKEAWEADGIPIESQLVRQLRFPFGRNNAKPWVVLVAEPGAEKNSRTLVKNFNDALEALYPADPAASEPAEVEEGETTTFSDADDLLPDYSLLEQAEASRKKEEKEPTADEAAKERVQLQRIAKTARPKVEGWSFAYVDFHTQPHIVWRWWIWKIPVIVFITPSTSPTRTYDLRYWSIAWSKPSPSRILSVISNEERWKQLPVWDASHAPGGHNAIYVARVSDAFKRLYKIIDPIPSWVLMLGSTVLATQLIGLIHFFFPDKESAAAKALKDGTSASKDKVARAVAKTKERAASAKSSATDNGGGDQGVTTRSGRKSIPKKR